MKTMRPRTWGIVGGGILGMTLARRLAQAGDKVTLLEAAPHLGGLASAWTLGEVTWDRHYHVTLLSDTHLRSLLTELGLEQDMKWVQTRTGFYTDGRLHSLSNTVEFLRFPPLGLIDKFRLGLTIFYASCINDWRALEQIPVSDWLRRWSGRRTLEKIWLPLLRAKLGENYRETSAAFIWTTIARMYAARRAGLKKEMFGYVPGGYARILNRYTEALTRQGVRIRTGQPIRRVERGDEQLCIELESGEREFFDNVVTTLPAPVTAAVCPELTTEEKTRLGSIRYLGVMCVSVLINKPLAGFYVTNITDDWVPFTGVIEMSALVDRDQFGGKCLVYLPKYLSPNDPLFQRPDVEIEREFVDALLRMYPHLQRSDVLTCRISRVRHVVALPTLGYSQLVPPMKTSVPGLFIVNSAQILNGTLNVNETIQSAERAASELPRLARPARAGEAVVTQ